MAQKPQKGDEIIDLVNEKDMIIKGISRRKAHNNPSFLHREIGILLIDQQNRILLQKRSKNKSYPGMWVISAGGHIPQGQNIKEQAHKELYEELGFDTEIKFLHKEFESGSHESHFIYWFIANYTNQQIKPNPEEVETTKFVSQDSLRNLFKDFDLETHKKPFYNQHSVLAFNICNYYWHSISKNDKN